MPRVERGDRGFMSRVARSFPAGTMGGTRRPDPIRDRAQVTPTTIAQPAVGGGWAGGTYGSIFGDFGSVVDYLWDEATWAAIPGDLWVQVTVDVTFQADDVATTGKVTAPSMLGGSYYLDVDDRATAQPGGWAAFSSSWVEFRPASMGWADVVSATFEADAELLAGRMRLSWVAQPRGGKYTHTLVDG